jgi:2-keto-4-pentenoate hydratase/2-oxohepta-3-ene-1,7-dioic acid hydratase in catechol pathway
LQPVVAERIASGSLTAFAGERVGAPIARPHQILCIGLNYSDHAAETGQAVPDEPILFTKSPNTLIGPNDDVRIPRGATKPDWEVELGIVIGATVRRVSEDEAMAAVAGYTVVNDVSMRDWQNRTVQFLQGKAWDGCTPVGPALVTLDELGNPGDLVLRCTVNGVEMQHGRTSDLLFGPAAIVSYISRFTTLRPGDLIATGTPGGVGAGRSPQVFLKPGDVMTTTIEGVGTCTTRCRAGA